MIRFLNSLCGNKSDVPQGQCVHQLSHSDER